MLLAVDLGLRTGFALYGRDGRLVSYRSQNLGSKARLKRAAGSLLADHRDAERVVLEGGGDIADLWLRAAERAGRDAIRIDAHVWRKKLLLPREQRHGTDAKAAADGLARAVIEWSGAPRPKGPLRHDAAEAIAIGFWGVLDAGWLEAIPDPIRLRR
ncbi:hypothetical protein B1759_05195 [Rubrivirga sp. SAORIC476]|uniref:hypothetical protein n=1 Tax=Rubrivirga sp. SAORIC476 TaxID=1961794 RepID=UPI000BA9B556|nr:hypothetical protein [Rubrivirga sp. SAORIC476]PAP80770.1 hypothetical protein B1759_05195 [Rubrivirga sp. SAORIC476]